jgi:hypothetical protein
MEMASSATFLKVRSAVASTSAFFLTATARATELVSKLQPDGLGEETQDLACGHAAQEPHRLRGKALLRVQEHVGVHDAEASVGDVVQIHRSHASSLMIADNCLRVIFMGRSQNSL